MKQRIHSHTPSLFSTVPSTQNGDVHDVSPTWRVPVFRVELVTERELRTPQVSTPDEIAPILCDYLRRADREHFIIAMLATNLRIIGINTVHVGSLTASIVSAREVFKPAILANAASIICAHNHPSGNLEPSREDVRVSKRLVEAGKLLEIAVLDSLVLGQDGRYTSLAERGLLG